MEINICIPTFNRYDRLEALISSLLVGSVVPNIYVIDNGGEIKHRLNSELLSEINVHNPSLNIGVAKAWNWFAKNVSEIRIISNDDIIYTSTAIEKLVAGYVDDCLIFPQVIDINQFSCFILPDKLIERVGYFDEGISPNYAYFEDNDFSYRMQLLGANKVKVDGISIFHNPSSTLRAYSSAQLALHHKRFEIAKKNYVAKWGGLPGYEKYTVAYNG